MIPPVAKVLLIAAVLAATTGCSKKVEEALEIAVKERDEARATVSALTREKEEALGQIARLQAENQQLKLTPRYYFDLAATAQGAADAANTDEADKAAITAFQEVIRRFPEDPLGVLAADKVKELEKRIAGRVVALRRAQAEVLRLIGVCRQEAKIAEEISREHLVFTRGNDIDLNLAMAGTRRADPHRRAANKAKERAEELLSEVPDPGGQLADKVRGCDDTTQE